MQDAQRTRGFDPASAATRLDTWVTSWVPTLDVELRIEENYLAILRNHIQPRWGHTRTTQITPLDVTQRLKQPRTRYAA